MKDTNIYKLVTNTGSFLCITIKSYTKEPYNYVSIALDPYLDEIYSFGREKKYIFFSGFAKESIFSGSYQLFPKTTCALYKISVSKKSIFMKLIQSYICLLKIKSITKIIF